MKIFIDEQGNTHGVKSPLTEALDLPKTRRASHVEPVNPLLRVIFHWIRRRVPDDSIAAEVTRFWPCRWQARIFGGPLLGPFWFRSSAIRAEIAWLEEHLGGNYEYDNRT